MVAALSPSEIQGAKFREQVRAAGGLVVGDSAVDRETLRRAGATADRVGSTDDRPGYIEIDVGDGERVISIKQRDGTRVELHPLLTYAAAKKIPFYTRQIRQLQQELDACDEEEAWMAMADRMLVLDEKLARLSIPDLPDGFLRTLDMQAVEQMQEANRRMAAKVEKTLDPNPARRDGQP